MNTPQAIAQRLLDVRRTHVPLTEAECEVASRDDAYAVQNLTLAALGPARAWKVGAKSLQAEPTCAPLPAVGVLASGAHLTGPGWRLRGIEVELAVRFGRDLTGDAAHDPLQVIQAIDAALPAIEVVESRLGEWRKDKPLAGLADLQSHGALVLGTPVPWPAGGIDLRMLRARLTFDGNTIADLQGAHPTGELAPLLTWLAAHCERRGMPLLAGDIVTTGTCTGMPFAPPGARVQGTVQGIGTVDLRF